MRRPDEGRAPELDERGRDDPRFSAPRPPTQVLAISASHLSRDQLLNLALCCLVEARRHRPSILLDEAALAIAVERLAAAAEDGR